MLEKTVETYLVATVRCAGGDAYKFSSPARVSVPDRIVIFPPARIYFVELKRPGGKPSKGQLREHERLRALGCDVRVIDSREAVDAFVREANAAPAPYLHVYEYPSPFGGAHREFEPLTWNGQRPARTVPLYVKPQTENSRADALTDKRAAAIYTAAAASITGHPTFEQWCAALVRAILAASPVEQHEAAYEAIRPEPRTEGEAIYRVGNDGVCRVQAAPLEGTGNGAAFYLCTPKTGGEGYVIERAPDSFELRDCEVIALQADEKSAFALVRKAILAANRGGDIDICALIAADNILSVFAARAPRPEVAESDRTIGFAPAHGAKQPTTAPAGHCERAGGCVCGGDLPRVREGCSEWVKSGGAA